MTFLRMAGVVRESITDGPGIRFTIFSQGCPHKCKGCHNMQTWDFDGGKDVSIEKILMAIDETPIVRGVTFSGGEPFAQPEAFYELSCEIKKRGLDIVAYTGYTLEKLLKSDDEAVMKLLHNIWLLVDGPFLEEEKDLSLKFRGSSNQRIIDVRDSLKTGKIVLANEYML